ncbi:Gfo/Idh/MocA family oxidoreductase [Larkinella terrae]|uniref:Twin-arginine translocation signal domain-containing protein n=1 Tax=Larkinella terrae TaxID=2025311 RepID=A0A7K0EJX7_9BACT|nr:Gfo/Idh/MocA family oxidoreductase [Larkinella terrae]MRS62139.1 twin-arginine translocation signal domain-containing protein [Larkinella terrae]
MNRRHFLKNSAVAATALPAIGVPTIVPASVFGKNAPSNRITIGLIGTGRQGYGQNLQGSDLQGIGGRIPGLLDVSDAQVVAVCDVDSWRMNKAKTTVESHYAKKAANGAYKGCSTHRDFREIIARKDIDAVMISTPDYWHVPMGILAAKANKHISCEKPLSMSVHQGRALVDALKKYGVVNRTDSEFRSVRPQNQAVELVRNGRIGKLQKIEITFPSDPTPVPPQPDMLVPKELDYDLWLGPAPMVPYTDMRVHTPFDLKKRPNWMRIDTYAQGMIANWGAHYFDVAQWANNSEYSGPVEVEGKGEFPKSLWNSMINFSVTYRYANGVEITCQQTPTSKPGIKYTGSEGWILVDNYPGVITSSNPGMLTSKPSGSELDLSKTLWDKVDFVDAIKTGRKTLEPIEVGHRTISLSQIGLIACQLSEKLNWNPEKELFVGNNAANALLAAPLARKEWAM